MNILVTGGLGYIGSHTIKELGLNENIIVPACVNIKLPRGEINKFFMANLEKIKEYDAVITTISREALLLSKFLNAEKIKIQECISLVSFFEDEEAKKAGIVSYSPDLLDIGYKSESLLDGILNDENHHIKQLKIKPQLILGSST